jgi:16S rRNA (adenine1518-N6/adenine1519-N6)-dimethyltransferase
VRLASFHSRLQRVPVNRATRAPPPKKSFGQHFLSDPRVLRKIVVGAGVGEGQRVLEIGPGPGALTRALLETGATVWAVEADPRMVTHLADQGLARLHLIAGDALRVDYLTLAREAGGAFRLVGNIPYSISGPLLARLLRQRRAFTTMTLMLQREVAERLTAPAGRRSRGRLGVMAQCFCSAHTVMRLPPGAFHPPPKVESQLVRLEVLADPPTPLADEEMLWAAVRVGFGKRRKMLRNALKGLDADLDAALSEAGLSGTERPESLDVESWIRLANALCGLGGGTE